MANKKITELMAGTPTRDSYLESATDVGGTTVSRKFEVGAVVDLNNVQIASEYDDTATYAYGDYCIKDGVLYRCTTAISVAEAWTSAHWTAVMVTGEYKRVRIMTKAQFDLLSNDEKDGFIYVSDYPTKIQDIDNVTLTTSDNNKLLGSFVENGELVVKAQLIIARGIAKFPAQATGTQTVEIDISSYGFSAKPIAICCPYDTAVFYNYIKDLQVLDTTTTATKLVLQGNRINASSQWNVAWIAVGV